MGLLSRISAGLDVPAEESPLLKEGLSFFEFVKKHNLSHVAVFERVNTFYVFSHSYGFDGDTILQSISTSDFWEGTVEENKWNYFSREENNLNTVLQFFSNNLKASLPFVNIYFSNNKVLLTAFEAKPDYGIMEQISNDFTSIDFSKFQDIISDSPKDGIILKMNIKEAASEILGNLNNEIKSVLENAFFTETFAFLSKLIDLPDSFSIDQNKDFTISVNTKSHITKESLEAFFKNALKPVYKNSSSLISYEY